jgi:DedD protein
MAFFKFRKAADGSAPASAQVPSVESIRQRAKYRLVGASMLVLMGVIGLPLLFDKQPRPIAVDMPIDIPDKNKVLPLVMPIAPVHTVVPPTVDASAVSPPAEKAASSVVAAASLVGEMKSSANVEKTEVDKAQDASIKIAKNVLPKVSTPEPASSVTGAAKPAVATAVRYVVQVGAFSDNARAHEVRVKLERAGLKTYAQVAQTADGRRVRVRLGPFSSKAEADKAAEKIKALNLPAALLTL